MATLTLEIDNALAEVLASSAKREHKPLERWVTERLELAAMEETALANGYPAGWLKLFGAISDEDGFGSPPRTPMRPVEPLNLEW